MKNRITIATVLAASVLVTATCVAHRDTRTDLFNENVYLDKQFLTRANPNHVNAAGEADDFGWLMGLTVTAVSVPTPITDIFPGLQSDVMYVRFGFSPTTMQITDGIVPGPYDATGNLIPAPDASDLAPRVLQEYEGNHVDLQLRRTSDGEITNWEEENREREWEYRQWFKFQPEKGAFSDLSKLSWYYDWAVSPAMVLGSTSLVPGSYHWVDSVAEESNMCYGMDEAECQVDWAKGDYMEWTVRSVYSVQPWYSSLMNFRANTDTQTVDIKYSFWRKPDPEPGNEYVPRPIAEKDKYRRQFGIWDYVVHNYQDTETGLIGAESMLLRFNPREPIDYYLVDVPEEFVPAYDLIEEKTNAVFENAGVDARIAFHEDRNEGNIPRSFGDIRYSFVNWHNNMFTDIPWLGYGPSLVDPRTGEIFNATLNFNNYLELHWYTYVVKDFLEQVSDSFDPEHMDDPCTDGDMRPVIPATVQAELMNTTLYSKLTSYMGEEPEDWPVEHPEEWYDWYHMLQQDLRFFYPPYQTFVYSGREAGMADLKDMREDLMTRDQEFWRIAGSLDSIESPTGYNDFTAPGAIEAGVDFLARAKDSMSAHNQLTGDRLAAAGLHAIDLVDGPSLMGSIENISQRCVGGSWQTYEEWEDEIRFRIATQVSIHELGHNVGQYHNFMGSVDRPHYVYDTEDPTKVVVPMSTVMEYVHHFAEVGRPVEEIDWLSYDKATLTYAYRYDSQEAVDTEADADIIRMVHPEWHDPDIDPADEESGPDGAKHMERAYLYCNDYHSVISPFCKTFDLGTTPTEIVANMIQYYDWQYKFSNFRSFRQYWETWTYPNRAFSYTYPYRRFLDLWALDWNGSDLENDLRILGVEGDTFFFDNVREEFGQEMGQANRLLINFYLSILTQSNSERSYATTYDGYFGDVTRMGIIYDKFYAMLTFLGLWPVDYNWDMYAYLAYYEGSWGNAQCYSDALNVVDSMLGGAYDVYPWFLPTAVLLYAQDTHDINFGDQAKKEWIGFRTFERLADMIDFFGFDPRYECLSSSGVVPDCTTAALGSEDDGHQTFHDAEGGKWVYVYLDDRNQHVVTSADMSPASYKLVWDYNEDVNISHADYVSTYSIKYYIDYYEYFN